MYLRLWLLFFPQTINQNINKILIEVIRTIWTLKAWNNVQQSTVSSLNMCFHVGANTWHKPIDFNQIQLNLIFFTQQTKPPPINESTTYNQIDINNDTECFTWRYGCFQINPHTSHLPVNWKHPNAWRNIWRCTDMMTT